MGATPLSSSCEVTITLTDINDNSPVFRQSKYSVNVSEELAVGTVLITITADDRDQGFAGEVRYIFIELVPPIYTPNKMFLICRVYKLRRN